MFAALALLAALLQGGPPPAPSPDPVDVQVRVPSTFLHASFEARGFVRDARLETRLSAQFGSGALLAGNFGGASVTLRAEPDEPRRSSRARRDDAAGSGRFEVGEIACASSEQRLPGEDNVMVRYDAYPVGGGRAFELHVSAPRATGIDSLTREGFETLVRSWRLQVVRRGQPADLPRPVRDAMSRALGRWPDWRAPLEAELAERKDDVSLAFSMGELLRFAEAPKEQVLTAHARAAELFGALEEPTVQQRAAWALCEESRGIALLQLGQLEPARERLRRARELSAAIGHGSLPGICYNLACACARLGQTEEAVIALADAINGDEQYRARAASDPDLTSLANHPRFAELLRQD